MIYSKSKLFFILLGLMILLIIFEITCKGINTIQKRIDSVALKDIGVEDV